MRICLSQLCPFCPWTKGAVVLGSLLTALAMGRAGRSFLLQYLLSFLLTALPTLSFTGSKALVSKGFLFRAHLCVNVCASIHLSVYDTIFIFVYINWYLFCLSHALVFGVGLPCFHSVFKALQPCLSCLLSSASWIMYSLIKSAEARIRQFPPLFPTPSSQNTLVPTVPVARTCRGVCDFFGGKSPKLCQCGNQPTILYKAFQPFEQDSKWNKMIQMIFSWRNKVKLTVGGNTFCFPCHVLKLPVWSCVRAVGGNTEGHYQLLVFPSQDKTVTLPLGLLLLDKRVVPFRLV